jgi:ElaB/YqjD/DUF883 family membrane-anchored ribosome-binding protein
MLTSELQVLAGRQRLCSQSWRSGKPGAIVVAARTAFLGPSSTVPELFSQVMLGRGTKAGTLLIGPRCVLQPRGGGSRQVQIRSLTLTAEGVVSLYGVMEANMARARTTSTPAASDRSGRDVKEDFDSLRADVDTLRKDLGTLVNTLKDSASSRAEAELDAMRERVATLTHDLQTTGQQQLRIAERKIEEQPLMSVAIAFATGLVVGRLLDRRSSISAREGSSEQLRNG